jgi:hypothetical protein
LVAHEAIATMDFLYRNLFFLYVNP